ncbi:MAG: HEAT repeat domain-containing protein [Chloroflexi bacterium]|uniref:HEAT repeat domain-containing protein n=1 Tax=Candidatus Chlorohelix allophototropha TaxID=3003348 RepID=A0A8T7MA10_9CHLR|nr:HEAT repeat domain-containing protein [Chloroflexota bacterium]WJW68755.1 HEAT repeat domain-containing protein [Chloroflexota bacterium L227-S17]
MNAINHLEIYVNKRIAHLAEMNKIPSDRIEQLHKALSILAFNLTDSKYTSGNKSNDATYTPVWADAIDLNIALKWLFRIKTRKDSPQKEAPLRIEEKQEAEELLGWATTAGLIFQTEQLVCFKGVRLQNYFCAKFCTSQLLEPEFLDRVRLKQFKEMLPMWAAFDSTLVPNLISRLQEVSDYQERLNIVRVLGFIGDQKAIEILLQVVKNKDETTNGKSFNIRSEASKALRSFRDNRILQALLEIILDEEEDFIFKIALVETVGEYPEALEELVLFLKHLNPKVRELAAIGLKKLSNKAAIEPLLTALNDSYPEVREQVLAVLEKIGGGNKLVEIAIMNCLQDRENKVRGAAIEALYRIDPPNAAVPLANLLLKENEVRVLLVLLEHLGKLKDTRALPALLTRLKHPDKEIRLEVIYALDHRLQVKVAK